MVWFALSLAIMCIYVTGFMVTKYAVIRIYGDRNYPWGNINNSIHVDCFAAFWMISLVICGPIWLFKQLYWFTKNRARKASSRSVNKGKTRG